MTNMAAPLHFPSVRYVLLDNQFKERIELKDSHERSPEDTAKRYRAEVRNVRTFSGAFGDIELVWLEDRAKQA